MKSNNRASNRLWSMKGVGHDERQEVLFLFFENEKDRRKGITHFAY